MSNQQITNKLLKIIQEKEPMFNNKIEYIFVSDTLYRTLILDNAQKINILELVNIGKRMMKGVYIGNLDKYKIQYNPNLQEFEFIIFLDNKNGYCYFLDCEE